MSKIHSLFFLALLAGRPVTVAATINASDPPNPPLTLSEALDTPGGVWTTSDSAPWVGQTNVTHDGVDAARSGAAGEDESS